MNAATVRANLRDSMDNVTIEPQNDRRLITETTDLASMREKFLHWRMRKVETYGRQYLNARNAHANSELVKTIKNADLKKKEKSADWNKTQKKSAHHLTRI